MSLHENQPRSPFEIIHEVTSTITDVSQQQIFLRAFTLNNWADLYRLSLTGHNFIGATHEELFKELSANGLHRLVSSVVGVMAELTYDTPGFGWSKETNDYRFNLMATIEQAIVTALEYHDRRTIADCSV